MKNLIAILAILLTIHSPSVKAGHGQEGGNTVAARVQERLGELYQRLVDLGAGLSVQELNRIRNVLPLMRVVMLPEIPDRDGETDLSSKTIFLDAGDLGDMPSEEALRILVHELFVLSQIEMGDQYYRSNSVKSTLLKNSYPLWSLDFLKQGVKVRDTPQLDDCGEVNVLAFPITEDDRWWYLNAVKQYEQKLMDVLKYGKVRLLDLQLAKQSFCRYSHPKVQERYVDRKDLLLGREATERMNERANLVFGLYHLERRNITLAMSYLRGPLEWMGSRMRSFGPNMLLVKALLEKGQRDGVLDYFEELGHSWEGLDKNHPDWKRDVRAGKIPDFGANLDY